MPHHSGALVQILQPPRICPGRFLAFAANWTATASILATFRLSEAEGEAVGPNFVPGIAM
jgi:hypothetical protein